MSAVNDRENHLLVGDESATADTPIAAPSAVKVRRPDFYLESLRVQGFRAIDDVTFTFQPGLNVIIGANNAAKTAVIDALRILLSLGTWEKREDFIRVRPTDVHRDGAEQRPTRRIAFSATFLGRNERDGLPSQFFELACENDLRKLGEPSVEYMAFCLSYAASFELRPDGGYRFVNGEVRGGEGFLNSVSNEALDTIRCVYLAPLRDLVNDRARIGDEIERLIKSHAIVERAAELTALPQALRTLADSRISEITADRHRAEAGRTLSAYARPYQIPADTLRFVPAGISTDFLGSMQPEFVHLHQGGDGLPNSSNGLGINQLIYASIILADRGRTKEEGERRTFFLIEEPEAHLHPQLQDSFFHALNDITDHQIFVTSHSPTITAKTDIDKITVMRRSAHGPIRPTSLAAVFKDQPKAERYLHKFLDVTRSQLLFANGAIFVEGVTESMLVQRFSELIGCNLRNHGVEIVIIGSSHGFDHFRPLFSADSPYHRAVFITDSDIAPATIPDDDTLKQDTSFALDPGLTIDGTTATATGLGTFEFGLLRTAVAGGLHAPMLAILQAAMAAAAPTEVSTADKRDHFTQDFLDHEHPARAYRKMKANSRRDVPDGEWYDDWHTNSHFRKAKSEFAANLYDALADLPDDDARTQFVVPKYISDAIRWVTATIVQEPDGPVG